MKSNTQNKALSVELRIKFESFNLINKQDK